MGQLDGGRAQVGAAIGVGDFSEREVNVVLRGDDHIRASDGHGADTSEGSVLMREFNVAIRVGVGARNIHRLAVGAGAFRVCIVYNGHANGVSAGRKRTAVHHISGPLRDAIHSPFQVSGCSCVHKRARAIAVVDLDKVCEGQTGRFDRADGHEDVGEVQDHRQFATGADQHEGDAECIDGRSGQSVQSECAVAIVCGFALFFAIGVGEDNVNRRNQAGKVTEVIQELRIAGYP